MTTSLAAIWSIMGPALYKRTMRDYVGNKMVLLTQRPWTGSDYQGGGSGFHIKAPSGKVYIMTNRHVCSGSKNGQMTAQILGVTAPHKTKIITMSDRFDLCLLEPTPGIAGLEVSDVPPVNGETAIYVGHPRLQPRTYDSGEVVGNKPITINAGIIGRDITEEQCKTKDSSIVLVPEILFLLKQVQNGNLETRDLTTISEHPAFKDQRKVRVCRQRNLAMVTTLMIYSGASGSPVVNDLGKVIGVVYAAPETGGWGYAVTLADIKTILHRR